MSWGTNTFQSDTTLCNHPTRCTQVEYALYLTGSQQLCKTYDCDKSAGCFKRPYNSAVYLNEASAGIVRSLLVVLLRDLAQPRCIGARVPAAPVRLRRQKLLLLHTSQGERQVTVDDNTPRCELTVNSQYAALNVHRVGRSRLLAAACHAHL